ncbi:MAG: sialidase family protein [Deltaproteobacteria bacterium]|nr:sialidase family protein [Deltaproteobacteria bacterium]
MTLINNLVDIGAGGTMTTGLRTGVLFRNPSTHVRSVHAYFPSVVQMPDDRLIVAYTLGEAFESVNLRVHLSESNDLGETWQPLGSPAPLPVNALTSESGRLTVLNDGELLLLLVRHDRSAHPDMGLAEPVNFGFAPMKFCIARSSDQGRTWTTPTNIAPPLDGPAFEMCSPITLLATRRWLLPTSTWRGWDGALHNGNQMCAFISKDAGATWPRCVTVMRDPKDCVRYWESKIHRRPDRSLLAVAWAHDESTGADLANQFSLSFDEGETWSAPASTGLQGQTLTSTVLPDGSVLSAYRRLDRQGLWLNLARIDADRWVNLAEQPLWGHESIVTDTTGTLARRFQTLKFGAPSVTRLGNGQVFVAFWCYEDNVSIIRWFKFDLRA